jgi:hypothetical protein
MHRAWLLLAAHVVAGVLLGACSTTPGPRSPEECKVTTDPEACRKQFEHR